MVGYEDYVESYSTIFFLNLLSLNFCEGLNYAIPLKLKLLIWLLYG